MLTKLKKNVLIPDGESGSSMQVIRCLGITGDYNIFVVSGIKNDLTKVSRYCKKFYFSNYNQDSEGRMQDIVEIIKSQNIHIILPCFLSGFLFCIRYRKILEKYTTLPLISSDKNYFTAAYKNTLAKFCEVERISIPKTIHLEDNLSIHLIQQLNFPVLIKPPDENSGHGIKIYYSKDTLLQHISTLDDSMKRGCIIQEFLDLNTIGANVICLKGKIQAYTLQKGLITPSNEFGFHSEVQFFDDEYILNFLKSLMKKLSWEGIANIDILYNFDSHDACLLEINPRFWGTTLLGSLRVGVNFPDLLIKASLNSNFNFLPQSFKQINFAKFNSNYLWNKLAHRSKVKFYETDLAYILRDPYPMLIGLKRSFI